MRSYATLRESKILKIEKSMIFDENRCKITFLRQDAKPKGFCTRKFPKISTLGKVGPNHIENPNGGIFHDFGCKCEFFFELRPPKMSKTLKIIIFGRRDADFFCQNGGFSNWRSSAGIGARNMVGTVLELPEYVESKFFGLGRF